jgi:pimeloyl-ACP methyl ester carboxylesterase
LAPLNWAPQIVVEVPVRYFSSGRLPDEVFAIAFIKALGVDKVDVLGFSIGGLVAQEITVQAPDLVRRLILVGTGHRGMDMSTSKSGEIFSATYTPPEHLWLSVHFTPSASSRAAGLEFLKRKHLRQQDRDPEEIGQRVGGGEPGRA